MRARRSSFSHTRSEAYPSVRIFRIERGGVTEEALEVV
jgi:hypothetical protein